LPVYGKAYVCSPDQSRATECALTIVRSGKQVMKLKAGGWAVSKLVSVSSGQRLSWQKVLGTLV
jgi:hypothetical protein